MRLYHTTQQFSPPPFGSIKTFYIGTYMSQIHFNHKFCIRINWNIIKHFSHFMLQSTSALNTFIKGYEYLNISQLIIFFNSS